MKKRILLLDVLPVMSGIGIRTAVLADQPALFAIHETLFRDDISRIWGWDDRSQLENFHKEWNEVETLVIHHDGQLAGYIQKAIYPDHFYVLNLAVARPINRVASAHTRSPCFGRKPWHRGKSCGSAFSRSTRARFLSISGTDLS